MAAVQIYKLQIWNQKAWEVGLQALRLWASHLAPVILGVLSYKMQMTIPVESAVRICETGDVKALSTVTYLINVINVS